MYLGDRGSATVDCSPQQIQARIPQRGRTGRVWLAGIKRQQAHLQQAGDAPLQHCFLGVNGRRVGAAQSRGSATFAQRQGEQVTAGGDRPGEPFGDHLGNTLRSGTRAPARTVLNGLLRKQGHHHHQCDTHQQRRQQIHHKGASALPAAGLRSRLVCVSF